MAAIDAADLDGLMSQIAPDALVADGSRVFEGTEAIRTWADRETIRPGRHYEIYSYTEDGDTITWEGAFFTSPTAFFGPCTIRTRWTGPLISEWRICV